MKILAALVLSASLVLLGSPADAKDTQWGGRHAVHKDTQWGG